MAVKTSTDPGAAILEAGRRLVERQGSAFTTQEIIAEADVALQTFYRYFRGKDQFVVALIADLVRRHCETTRTLIGDLDSAAAGLEQLIRSTLAPVAGSNSPVASRFVTAEHWRLQERHPAEMADATRPFVELVSDLLTVGVHDGSLAPLDPDTDARVITTTVLGAYHHLAFRPADQAQVPMVDAVWRFCSAAVGVTDAARNRPQPQTASRGQ